jgi:glycosyltransferase involved in cell wall biosynthesis
MADGASRALIGGLTRAEMAAEHHLRGGTIGWNAVAANQEARDGITRLEQNLLVCALGRWRGAAFRLFLHGRPVLEEFRPSPPAVRCTNVRAMGPLLRLARPFAGARLEGSAQLSVSLATLTRRIDAYYQCAHAAIPLAVPDNTVYSVYDLAFMRSEFAADFPAELRDRLSRRLAAALKKNPRWLCISHSTATDLIRLCGVPEERVAVGWPAVAPGLAGDVPPDERLAWRKRFEIEGPFLLHVGTLQPRKNLRRLLAACDRLRQARGVPVQLVLVGQRGWLDAPVIEALDERSAFARYLGLVPDRALRALLAEARLLVCPALYEGFGLPALEAMAGGVPVAASNTGALPEVLGEAAVYFDPVDEEDIAAAIERVWHDPSLRADLAQRGRVRARQFSWDAMVDALGGQFAAGGLRIR